MKLNYLGNDSWNRPVYEDENGRLWKDTGLDSAKHGKVSKFALCSSVNNEFDGEPDTPMGYIKRYNDIEIELVFDKKSSKCN